MYMLLCLLGAFSPGIDLGRTPGISSLLWLAITVSVARLIWSTWGHTKIYPVRPYLWKRGFVLGALTTGGSWGVICLLLFTDRGFFLSSNIFMVASMGLCSGAVNTFAPSRRLSTSFVFVVLTPLLVLPFSRPEPETSLIAILVVAYLTFLWFQAKHASTSYWTTLLDKQLLEERAKELERARAQAEAASAARGQFLANMSHEIRTPMNGVLGMTALVLETKLSDEQREYLDIVRASSQSLLGLLNDILDFSKIEAGRLILEELAFDPCALAEETLRLFQARDAREELRIELEIDPDLPRRVIGDPSRLRQVLVNLLGNAVKFTERGFVCLAVQRDTSGSDGRLRFVVRDTGIGIPEHKREAIFELFAQADASTTRRHGGTGLGLAISAQLVRMMGGELQVAPREGGGSEFYFTLPLTDLPAIAPADEALSQESSTQHQQREMRPRRILLAEDNRVNSLLVCRALQRRGHEVIVAEDGLRAVELWRGGGFDLVLMDLQMPEMDGFEATCCIRAEEAGGDSRIPIIALTAHALVGEETRCLEAGMDDFLSKPFDLKRLIEMVESLSVSEAPVSSLQPT